MIRWSLVVSDKTDKALRTYLAQSGGRKGDLSRFIEIAVRDKLFHLQVAQIKERNQQYDQQEILKTVDEAVEWAHADRD